MNRQFKALSIILYILWPFSAVVIGIKNFDSAFGRNLLIVAFVFLGYTALESGDLERYATHYYEVSDMSLTEIFDLFLNLQISKLFNDVTSILFSPFNNHNLYFGFLFGVYGYFLVKTINLLRIRLLKKSNLPVLISFIAFAFFYSVLTVFNYAFYTGAIYFLYFLLQILLNDKNKKYYGLILLTPLFHIGLAPLILVPVFYLLFKKRTYLYVLVLIAFTITSQTALIKTVEVYFVKNDTVLEDKYRAYASEEGQERMDTRYSDGFQDGNMNYRLLRNIREVTNKIAIPLLILVLYVNRKIIRKDGSLLNLFNISIGCLAITQLMLNISQGERFYFVSGFMIIGTYAYYVQKFDYRNLRFNFLLFLIIPSILLNNLVSIYLVKNLISSDFLFSNFPYLLFNLL